MLELRDAHWHLRSGAFVIRDCREVVSSRCVVTRLVKRSSAGGSQEPLALEKTLVKSTSDDRLTEGVIAHRMEALFASSFRAAIAANRR